MSANNLDCVPILASEGYEFESILSTKKNGTVVLATKKGQKYAIKVTTNISLFQAEVMMLNKLGQHPNVVKYLGSWSSKYLHFINLEYIPGQSLLEILMKTRLTEIEAHCYFHQLVDGMTHAHDVCRLIHRDLKAENILIAPGGRRLFIIDWGMSTEWSPYSRLVQTCGSPDYAAPEIYKRVPYVGPEVDIWAMGVILFAMVTSDFPFPGETALDIAFRVCKGQYTPPAVSDGLCNLISRMLTVAPNDRITLKGIRAHPWFLLENQMLSSSMWSPSELSASTLHKSSRKADIYAKPNDRVTDKSSKNDSHSRKHSKKKSKTSGKSGHRHHSRRGSRIGDEKAPSSRRHRHHFEEEDASSIHLPATNIQSDQQLRAQCTEGVVESPIHSKPSASSDVSEEEPPPQQRPRAMSLFSWKKKQAKQTQNTILH